MLYFNLLPIIVVFAFLAIFDLLGSRRINLIIILIAAIVIIAANNFIFLNMYYLLAGVISIGILTLLPLGMGDKLVLSVVFLIYPFYIPWVIIIIAFILSKPIVTFKRWIFEKMHKHTTRIEVAFYPFLFVSALIVYLSLKILLLLIPQYL